MHFAIEHEARADARNTSVDDYHQYSEDECQHCVFGTWIRILDHLINELDVFLRIDDSLLHTLLVNFILVQFLADSVLDEGCYENGNQGGWNTYQKDMLQFDAGTTQ